VTARGRILQNILQSQTLHLDVIWRPITFSQPIPAMLPCAHAQCAPILFWDWRYINYLLTYLLTYLGQPLWGAEGLHKTGAFKGGRNMCGDEQY